MLERMRRGYTRQAYDDLVQHARRMIPGVALSTDIISGVLSKPVTPDLPTHTLRCPEQQHLWYALLMMRKSKFLCQK